MRSYPGGFITATAPTVTSTSAKGIWTVEEALQYIKAGNWPLPPPPADTYFNYTTLLLPGDGTNGAQNNTFLDSSTNAFSITRNGNTTQGTFSPFSQTGWSNYFNGSSYLTASSVGTNFSFGTGDFTWECWAWFPDTTTDSGLFGNSANGEMGIRRFSTGKIGISRNNVAIDASSSATVPANQWVHLAISRASGTLRIFINGSQEYSASNSNSYDVTTSASIGTNNGVNAVSGSYISNMRIVKTGGIYTAAFTPSTTPLTTTVSSGTVTLLSCQSNRFSDNSTNAFALSVTGSPSVQAFSPFAPTDAYSAATNGGSGYFDGSGDYLSPAVGEAFNFGTSAFTVECWAYFNSTATGITVFGNGTTGGNTSNGVVLYFSASGTLKVFGPSVSGTVTSTSVTTGQWTHLAVTRSSNTFTLYVNGVSQGTFTDTGSVNGNDSNSPFRIGSLGLYTTYVMNGYISGFRVVKGTALSISVPTAPPTAISGTSLLCNFTNAGITDATAKNNLETVGNAQISNGAAKFGSTSMYFDGTGDYLYLPSSQNWSLGGDFTIEFWNQRITTGYDYLFTIGDSKTSTGLEIYKGSGGNIYVTSANVATINGGTAPTYNTWVHYALVRYGSTITFYINGTSVGTWTSATATFSGNLYVGAEYYNGSIAGSCNGYIQDFRITKGIARYTANFTAPTAAFSLR